MLLSHLAAHVDQTFKGATASMFLGEVGQVRASELQAAELQAWQDAVNAKRSGDVELYASAMLDVRSIASKIAKIIAQEYCSARAEYEASRLHTDAAQTGGECYTWPPMAAK